LSVIEQALAAFDSAFSRSGAGEFSKYFAIQHACHAALPAASSAQQLALAEAERTAERLGRALEATDGAIRSEDEAYWKECASRLRAMVELGSSGLSAGEITLQLSSHRSFFCDLKSPI
jgi:hypothetical protein